MSVTLGNGLLLAVIGLIIGTISGLLGVGSAIILIPALTVLLSFQQKTAQGMALLIMVPTVIMAAVRYWMNPACQIHLPTVLLIACFAIIGANIGSSLAFNLPVEMLRKSFAVFIIIAGVLMLWKA